MKLKMLKSLQGGLKKQYPTDTFAVIVNFMLNPRNRESVLFNRELPHLLYFRVSIVLAIIVFVIQPPTF